MNKVKLTSRKWFELALLRVARYVVYNRNLKRSPVISRKDNNRLFDIGCEIEAIENRIKRDYE